MNQTRKLLFLFTATVLLVASALAIAGSSNVLISMNSTQGLNSNSRMGAGIEADSKMMMAMVNFKYVAAETLSDEQSSGHVYQLQLTGDPKQLLAKVAVAFGLNGDAREATYSTPEFPAYIVGDEAGAAPSVQVQWSMAGSWGYSNPLAYPAWECKTRDANDECIEWKEQQPTPELLPSEAEAKAKAIKIFAATGAKFTANDIRITKDSMQVFATATQKIGEFDSPLDWAIGWSSNGNIAYANGYFATAIDKGEYKTISAKAAVERIADWRWQGSASNKVLQKYYPVAAVEDAAGQTSIDMPVTEENPTQPKDVTVTVKSSEACLLMILDGNSASWLVPGYVLATDQSWTQQIISLEDGVIQLPPAAALDGVFMTR